MTRPSSSSSDLLVAAEAYLDLFRAVYVPAIISVGIVGNAVSLLVLLATPLKRRSCSYYLAALAVSDSAFLLALALAYFRLYDLHGWCQLTLYTSYVAGFLSVWFVVAFTVERFVAVRFPLRKPSVCTVARAKAVVGLFGALALALHLYVFWIAKVVDGRCWYDPGLKRVAQWLNYLDAVLTLFVPVGLIVGMNGMIAWSLWRFRSRRGRDFSDIVETVTENCEETYEMNNAQSTSSTKKPRENSESPDSGKARKLTANKNTRQKNSYISIKSSSRYAMSVKTQHNINKMLLVTSSVFIILNMPSYLLRFYEYFEEITKKQLNHDYIKFAQHIAILLYYTNFSINFLLYIMCGETFRLCLRNAYHQFSCVRR